MASKQEIQATLVAYVQQHPDKTYRQIADILGCSESTVSRICLMHGIRRIRKALSEADLSKLEG